MVIKIWIDNFNKFTSNRVNSIFINVWDLIYYKSLIKLLYLI